MLMFPFEDDMADTVVPRLLHAKADMSRIRFCQTVRNIDKPGEHSFKLQFDMRYLRQSLDRRRDTKLVIFDPIMEAMGGGKNANSEDDVRETLQPLIVTAQEFGVAVILVMHNRKAAADNALHRVSGSGAFTALARSAWTVDTDPTEDAGPEDRLFLVGKLNIARAAPGMRFSIIDPGIVAWDAEPVNQTANDLFSAKAVGKRGADTASKMREATAFLRDELEGSGRGVRTTELKVKAENRGIRWRTVERAKKNLPIVADQTWSAKDGNEWYWNWDEGTDGGSDD